RQYQSKGYGAPMRIGLVLENRPDFFVHWLALNALGCSVLPISAASQLDEIAYFLEHGEPVLVVTIPERVDLLERACQLTAKPVPVIGLNRFRNLPEAPSSKAQLSGPEDNGKLECALLYTSGSTGKPKGCILSNEYFTQFGHWYRCLGGLAQIAWGEERLLTPLPLGHMNAMAVSTTGMIMNGGCIIQLDRFHSSTWWQTVRESKATILHYLGVLPAILLKLPVDKGDDFSGQIRFGFGAGVNPDHHQRFEQRFGFPLIESWAMTECGSGGCITANREPRHVGSACFGFATDTVQYQVVDEQKLPVIKGDNGELRVRANGAYPKQGFFSGYLKDPEATNEAWAGGWLNTGDIVRQGEDGQLHFVDRLKNVIRRSGENISALAVETHLLNDPVISEVIVTAVPDETRGDEVAACVVLGEKMKADEDMAVSIVLRSLSKLTYYKVPGYIIFCDELPKTASNKPRRAEITALAVSRLNHECCWDTRYLKKRQINK
ncbi:MAG TPA: ATP-dependent acyl-CoA ligase, partial [Gammaproteobacteria bacterium]|nr:ATP-dependent acyl-CoA ligase [Gammaproteobacteria bacterium]